MQARKMYVNWGDLGAVQLRRHQDCRVAVADPEAPEDAILSFLPLQRGGQVVHLLADEVDTFSVTRSGGRAFFGFGIAGMMAADLASGLDSWLAPWDLEVSGSFGSMGLHSAIGPPPSQDTLQRVQRRLERARLVEFDSPVLGGSIPDTAATQRGALHRHFMQVGLETLELDQEDLRIFLSVAKSWNPKSPDDLTDMFEVQSLTLAANIAQRLLENDELLGDRLWDDLMALSIDLDHLCDDAISAPVLPLWSRPTPSTGAKRGRSRLFDFYTDRQGFEVSVPGFAGDEFERFMEVLQYWHPKFWLDTVLACGGKDVGAALYVAEGVLMHGELLGHPYRRKLKRFYNTFDKWSRQE